MSHKIYIPFLILSLVILASCEKVITIDLNKANPRLVVEAKVTDTSGPYTVKLTRTANYFDRNNFPAVSGATVTLSDNAGNSETLKEDSAGIYITDKLHGTSGRTYTLSINESNKNYTAQSTMPKAVEIDSIGFEKDDRGPRRDRPGITAHLFFTDPPEQGNYYRVETYVNDSLGNDNFFRVLDDKFENGKQKDIVLFGKELHPGDHLRVVLMCIDKAVYDYFSTLNDIMDANTLSNAAPQNPTTNLSNGAQGYFGAITVRTKAVVVPF